MNQPSRYSHVRLSFFSVCQSVGLSVCLPVCLYVPLYENLNFRDYNATNFGVNIYYYCTQIKYILDF